MHYLIDPFRQMYQLAAVGYSVFPGVCQGLLTVFACLALWVVSLVIAHRASK